MAQATRQRIVAVHRIEDAPQVAPRRGVVVETVQEEHVAHQARHPVDRRGVADDGFNPGFGCPVFDVFFQCIAREREREQLRAQARAAHPEQDGGQEQCNQKEDMIELGKISAEMFDEVIIRQDQHLRGRSADEIISYLREGIQQYDPLKKTLVIKDEKEAVIYAIENARKGSLIVICSEMIKEVTKLIQQMREEDQEPNYDVNGKELSPAT